MKELGVKDRKIIYELSRDARQSENQIGKKVGVSKEVVNYKVNNFLKNGIIRRFITIINTERLGFHRYEIYLGLKNIDEKKEKDIAEWLAKNPNSLWVRSSLGEWDILSEFYTKDILDFEKTIKELKNKLRENIDKIDSSRVIVEYAFPLKCIDYDFKEPLIEAQSEENKKKAEVDEKDIKILRELSRDARINVVDISKKTGINTDTIIYRIKKLMKDKMILGFRSVISENFLGLSRYKLLISLKDIDEKKYNSFLSFINSIKSTQYVKRCIGNWDFSLTLLCKDMDELRRVVLDIKNHLGESMGEYKLILLFEEHKNNYFPEGIKL